MKTLQKTDDKIIDLEAIRNERKGLMTGGPTGPENWLKELPEGSVFVAQRKDMSNKIEGLILNKYLITKQMVQSTNMIWATPDSKQIDVWVPSLEFSRKFTLIEVIGQIALGQEEQTPVEETPESQEVE